jgi:hypothetical protein
VSSATLLRRPRPHFLRQAAAASIFPRSNVADGADRALTDHVKGLDMMLDLRRAAVARRSAGRTASSGSSETHVRRS